MFKKLLTFIMAILMLSTAVIASAQTDADAEKTNKAITLLYDFGIIDLTKENPDETVTRGKMVELIAHVLNKGEIPVAKEACVFSDVTDASLVNAVMWANEKKVVTGNSAAKFNPDADITMQDAYVMVVRAMRFETRKALKYPSGHLHYADIYGINKNLKDKKKGDAVTYSDAATLLYNMLSCPDVNNNMLMETLYGKKGLKVVTFNTRNSYTGDGINSYIYRIGFIADKIYKENPDVICFQELSTVKAFDMMKILLADYEIIGPGKNRGSTVTGTYIAVKKDTCTIVGWDSIWISDSPHTPDSRFEEQSKYPRICVQTLVRHKASGKLFRVFNAHLDNESEVACVKGMEVVLKYIDEYKEEGRNYPIMLMGDFNSLPTEETIAKCNQYEGITEVSENVDITFHRYGAELDKVLKYDYIFMSDELAEVAGNSETWTDMQNGIYLSDHYPICIQLWFE